MPQLIIDNFTILNIEIVGMSQEITSEHAWADIRLRIKNKYIYYDKTSSFLLVNEIKTLIEWLDKLLNLEIKDQDVLSFVEPELTFIGHLPYEQSLSESEIIYPKDGIHHHPLTLQIVFNLPTDTGIYCGQSITFTLAQNEIQEFYDQLILEYQFYKKYADEINHYKAKYNQLIKPGINFFKNHVKSELDYRIIKEKMEEYINVDPKRLLKCAIAKYNEYGKLYTFLVHDFVKDAKWFVEDSMQKVEVQVFCKLLEKDLPVEIDKMKYLHPIVIQSTNPFINKKIEKYQDVFIEEEDDVTGDYLIYHNVEDVWGILISSDYSEEYIFLDENEFEDLFPVLEKYFAVEYDFYDFSYIITPSIWQEMKKDFLEYIFKLQENDGKENLIKYIHALIYYIEEYLQLGKLTTHIGIWVP